MIVHLSDVTSRLEPAWSTKVDRWYQLDEISFAVCDAVHHWDFLREFPKPDLILLALPGASNIADKDFVTSGAISPAKFVYTLPNICISVLFQMVGFHAKALCLNKGNQTIEFALSEAEALAKSKQVVWVIASSPVLEGTSRRVMFQCFT